jgi:peptidyl-prolyl cis-trans isomerase D
MTMLDRMRRHRSWLKWSLGIVVVAFVVLYIPSFLSPAGVGASPNETIATVNGRAITLGTYERVYNQQMASMQETYGATINETMMRQLQIPQRILQQLIDEEAVMAEADLQGIRISDGELLQRIMRLPAFQRNGQFVGDVAYRQVLDMNRPPMRPADFEREFRKALRGEKLQAAITDWVTVSDADVEQAYRRANEKVKVELAVFTANQFQSGIQPTEAEISAEFTSNKETYRMPEKRRVRYLAVDAESLRAKMTATEAEVAARYQTNIATYQTPEQVRASHILLKTDGKDEAAVKKVAEGVLAKAKAAGANFGALAKQFSEDDASKANGGDLDYFGKGTMVPEFDAAAWALAPGQMSDLVKTKFGFHIIKIVDKRAAATKPLADVKAQLVDQIKSEKAQAEASKVATDVAARIKSPEDLDKVAAERGLMVNDSGLFARDEPIAGLGFAPAVSTEAFSLEQGKVSGLLTTGAGFAFITVVEVKPAYLPTLEEVKEKVRGDVVRTKSVDVARQRAATMAQAGKANFAAAAKAAGVEVKTTDFIARGASYPEVGVSDTIDAAVFALKAGETTPPVPTDTAVVVARVKERQEITPANLDAERDTLRARLLQERRGQFFAAYMTKAKDPNGKIKIWRDEDALLRIFGGK